MLVSTIFILSAILASVSCDYKCLCNYNVEKSVFAATSTSSTVLGYMYEFDCKPAAGDAGASGWLAVAFEHELGFVESDAQVQVQTCPGSIPDEDKLPPKPTSVTLPSTIQTTSFKTSSSTTANLAKTSAIATTAPVMTTKPVPITHSTSISYNISSPTGPLSAQNMTSSTTNAKLTSSTISPSLSSISPIKTSISTFLNMNLTTSSAILFSNSRSTIGSITQSTINVTQPTIPSTTAERSSTVSNITRSQITNVTTSHLTSILLSSPTMTQTPTTVVSTSNKPGTSHILSTMTTTVTPVEGHTKLCPLTVQLKAKHSHATTLAQFRGKCYEVIQTKVSWLHAEINCLNTRATLVDIRSQEEQDFIYHYLESIKSHTIWLGLHDRNDEEKFQWTSGEPVSYTNWNQHRQTWNHLKEDCVYMTVNGTWNDIYCGSDNVKYEQQKGFIHSYICQYDAVDPLDGQLDLCPLKLHQQATKDNAILSQFGHSCYELVQNTALAWQHAEDVCQQRGGHLADIKSSQEQAFIQGFMQRYSPHSAVWIGLTDVASESKFYWTSGEAAYFTNWKQNHVNSNKDNCVILMPYDQGHWVDVPCGRSHNYTTGIVDNGETHPLLCEYNTITGPPIIG